MTISDWPRWTFLLLLEYHLTHTSEQFPDDYIVRWLVRDGIGRRYRLSQGMQ